MDTSGYVCITVYIELTRKVLQASSLPLPLHAAASQPPWLGAHENSHALAVLDAAGLAELGGHLWLCTGQFAGSLPGQVLQRPYSCPSEKHFHIWNEAHSSRGQLYAALAIRVSQPDPAGAACYDSPDLKSKTELQRKRIGLIRNTKLCWPGK